MNSDNDGIPQKCKFCGNEWNYSGNKDKSTCTNCSNKNWVIQAYERWQKHNAENQ